MAVLIMQPQSIGEVFESVALITGPASYANPGGQQIFPQQFALNTGFRYIVGAVSTSGTYSIEGWIKVTTGLPPAGFLMWFVVATGVQVANAVNLSAETVRILVIGN